MGLLTLPDLFRRKYGKLMEVIVSFIEVASFTCLLAGNLVGTSMLLQFIFGLPQWAGVLVSGVMMAVFTMAGGLFSIAYVDVPQVKFVSQVLLCPIHASSR
jgi:Na+/proline symporter